MKTKPETILLPDTPFFTLAPKTEGYVVVGPGGHPFKILKAEPVEGIDYTAFTCPGFFLGAHNVPAPEGGWPIELMFSGFDWPGGQLCYGAVQIPYVGMVDFRFRIFNKSDTPQRFQIKLCGVVPA